MPHRILVVDDDRQIARLVRSYLEQAGFSVLTAFDGEAALALLRSERPDLVVLDLMLPGRNGWEITRIVREDKHLAETPIIMLTARVEAADRIEGLELGADDYVPKPFNPREIVARVRAVLRRAQGGPTMPHLLIIGQVRLDLDQHTASRDGAAIDLTPTEFALLQTLMQHPNRAFTRLELIEIALGYAYEGMERTIDSHIKNLRKKLGVDPGRPAFIETVYGVGYRLLGEP